MRPAAGAAGAPGIPPADGSAPRAGASKGVPDNFGAYARRLFTLAALGSALVSGLAAAQEHAAGHALRAHGHALAAFLPIVLLVFMLLVDLVQQVSSWWAGFTRSSAPQL